ncbi:hypothetical protein WR25_21203 [Diploscapter pachys]|uniref:PSI domain-containing protein n=1 Tax=Diploscapter pachys TaxID=2018661 RepID=A0A2A2KXK6_9BILA|nr:hypothetical protein WR25_21203 [Diploscapter pachys]
MAGANLGTQLSTYFITLSILCAQLQIWAFPFDTYQEYSMRDDVIALGDEPENWITGDHSRSKRYKRDEKARVLDEDEPDMTATTPSNTTLQAGPQENDAVDDKNDHIYYTLSMAVNDTKAMSQIWVDIDKMLDQVGVTGNNSHPLLSKSYRRAVSAKLTFKFPFYGHHMSNLTIATGGFIYIGDQTHNWLAATQYIAPLMANFDTFLNNSKVLYADDGEKFVVEWRRVQLRENAEQKVPFTFQTILHKNGDIIFAYKDIPTNITTVSDVNHPVKLGISDAYLFQHVIPGNNAPKRVIYEYHRIELPANAITSNTVVKLIAQPTCMQYSKCEQCSNATLKHFKCSWCHAKKKNGGPFCTDESGLHRRRQQWVEHNCKAKSKTMYCDGQSDEDEVDDDESSSKSPVSPHDIAPMPGDKLKKEKEGGGYAALVILLISLLGLIGWVAFAYYNPHTTSGQFLIRYRPSQWHMPSSHVRYSASVHM